MLVGGGGASCLRHRGVEDQVGQRVAVLLARQEGVRGCKAGSSQRVRGVDNLLARQEGAQDGAHVAAPVGEHRARHGHRHDCVGLSG